MQVLMVTPRFFPDIGGVERYAQAISRCMLGDGEDVTIFTTDATGKLSTYEVIDGIEMFRFRSFAPEDLYFFSPALFKALLRVKDYDLIHVLEYQSFAPLAVACSRKINRIPCVMTPHLGASKLGMKSHRVYSQIGQYIIDQMSKIIITSPAEVRILEYLGIDVRDRTVYIPNGVNPKYFAIKRTRYGKKLLFLGRLEKYKGIQYILFALTHLSHDVTLQVAGDGPYRRELEDLTLSLGLSKRVSFLGRIFGSKLFETLSTCDILVLPSSYESLPMSVLEAMASGMPVVCSRIVGLRGIVIDKENGIVLNDSTDVKGLANKLAWLLTNECRLRNYGAKAREQVLHLSWDNIWKKTAEVYHQILS